MTDQREEPLKEWYNPISHLATYMALLERFDLEEDYASVISTSGMYCMDGTTTTVASIRLAVGSRANLAEVNKNPDTKGKLPKRRGIKQVYLTYAVGQLLCDVIIIKDRCLKELHSKTQIKHQHNLFSF
jgi:hypothetical protein